MKGILKIVALSLVVLVLLGAGGFGWASIAATRIMARPVETHAASFPIPFPLTAAELDALGMDSDPGNAVALERAIERGRHLVEARYACAACHGESYSGGVMMDAPAIARLFGPNITRGEGSVVAGFSASDWDRAVRHGVKRDGLPNTMPSGDFAHMTDQELSDIVAFLRSRPPMYGESPPVTLGPIGRVLLATGRMPLAADLIGEHDADHVRYPPDAAVSLEFGRHLAAMCTGCHGPGLEGGPVVGGDPSWPVAADLTVLGDWTLEQFVTALRDGRRPDGTPIGLPMTEVQPFARRMTGTELEALWTYLASLGPG